MATGRVRRAAMLVALAGGLHAQGAAAAAQWTCAKRLADGECIGPTTVYEDGEITSGVRAVRGVDEVVWTGRLSHTNRQHTRSDCSFAPTGRCDGQQTITYPDGTRRTETVHQRNGTDEYEGVAITVSPDGRRLECMVNAEGDCDGETVLRRASGEVLHGTRKVRDGESVWIGRGRWSFPNGLVKDCLLAEDATCRPGPVTLWDGNSRTVGMLGADGRLAGAITIYERSGLQKSCARAVAGACRSADLVVTRAPPGAWQKPPPRKALARRPAEVRAAFTPTATVVFSPEPDRAQLRYQFMACGDEIRLAYTLVGASAKSTVPFKGQVWRAGERLGSFSDPGASRVAMGTLSCRSAQTRAITTLKAREKDLVQLTFLDGSDAWTQEEIVRHYLDELTVSTTPVVSAPLAAPRPIPIAVALPVRR